jgi:hypothetical protein
MTAFRNHAPNLSAGWLQGGVRQVQAGQLFFKAADLDDDGLNVAGDADVELRVEDLKARLGSTNLPAAVRTERAEVELPGEQRLAAVIVHPLRQIPVGLASVLAHTPPVPLGEHEPKRGQLLMKLVMKLVRDLAHALHTLVRRTIVQPEDKALDTRDPW